MRRSVLYYEKNPKVIPEMLVVTLLHEHEISHCKIQRVRTGIEVYNVMRSDF